MSVEKFKNLINFINNNHQRSQSQCCQDLFVIFFTNYFGKIGYFVDIGAADGKHFSNTFVLESIGWKGILVEPINYDNESTFKRNSIKDKRCVYSESGLKLKFKEQSKIEAPSSKDPQAKEFSGLWDHLSDYAKNLTKGHVYEVTTVSLNDLLEQYAAPNKIDYISIDTEGSEFEILRTFDFTKYDVQIFTIEHNSASYREDIIKLLESKKYYRIPSGHFTPGFEDWYIKKDNPVLKKLGF
jgi:FkbM family methyltransferase